MIELVGQVETVAGVHIAPIGNESIRARCATVTAIRCGGGGQTVKSKSGVLMRMLLRH